MCRTLLVSHERAYLRNSILRNSITLGQFAVLQNSASEKASTDAKCSVNFVFTSGYSHFDALRGQGLTLSQVDLMH
jgi:hypothetical protein